MARRAKQQVEDVVDEVSDNAAPLAAVEVVAEDTSTHKERDAGAGLYADRSGRPMGQEMTEGKANFGAVTAEALKAAGKA